MRKYEISVKNKSYTIDVKEFSSDSAKVAVNGQTYDVVINDIISPQTSKPVPKIQSAVSKIAPKPPPSAAGSGSIIAPIPGSIMEVFVKIGDKVETGQTVVKMEAMKMENEVPSSETGTVKSVDVKAGDNVNQGQVLITVS